MGFRHRSRSPDAGAKFFPVTNRLSFSGPPAPPPRIESPHCWPRSRRSAGSISPQRGPPGRIHLSGDTRVHGHNDKLTYGPSTGGRHRHSRARHTRAGSTSPSRAASSRHRRSSTTTARSRSELKTAAPGDAPTRGLDFIPTHPNAAEALAWMGFEARGAILEVLDEAIADTKAQVRVVAYDLHGRRSSPGSSNSADASRSSSTTAPSTAPATRRDARRERRLVHRPAAPT